MLGLLELAFSPPLLVYTILFAIALAYGLTVLVGVFDFDAFDVDFDIDTDIDVDLDTDLEIDGNGGNSSFINFLKFFNFGVMPFMILYSFLTMSVWVVAMLVHSYFGDGTWLFSLAVFIPIIFIGLIITKIITNPLAKVFGNLEEDTSVNFIGEIGNVTLSPTQTVKGQMEIYHKSRFFILDILSEEDAPEPIQKGTEVIITRHDKEKNLYFVSITS